MSAPARAVARPVIHPDVEHALVSGRAVVALETAVLTHGLPRTAVEDSGLAGHPAGVPPLPNGVPLNLAAMEAMVALVRGRRAVPAVVAVLDGRLRIGLDEDELARLAADASAVKASSTRLAAAVAEGRSAGTTVSGTLAACRSLTARGLRVFATGGIGGVHRGWTEQPDVSADLAALTRVPIAVVSAGAKSLLDLPATASALESLGVPVLGIGTARFPRFHAGAGDDDAAVIELADAGVAAAACRGHWELGGGGTLVVQPPPAAAALGADEVEQLARDAEAAADAAAARGPARTPFVLTEMTRRSGGRTLAANLALLAANAGLGADLATRIAEARRAAERPGSG